MLPRLWNVACKVGRQPVPSPLTIQSVRTVCHTNSASLRPAAMRRCLTAPVFSPLFSNPSFSLIFSSKVPVLAFQPSASISIKGYVDPLVDPKDARDIALNTIRDNPGAKKKKRRIGRGQGSTKGKTAGRGMMGQKARSGGGPRPGFEGGQTPLYKKMRKFGFSNAKFKVKYTALNLNRLQFWIDTGRLDATKKITMKHLRDSGCAPRSFKHGIKLLADGSDWFQAPVDIEVSAVSKKAKEAVEKAGGKVTTVYFTKQGLWKFLHREPSEITTNFAAAPPKKQHRFDIIKYQLPSSSSSSSSAAQPATAAQ